LNRQRTCKSAFFGHWSKAKFVVKFSQVGYGSGFQQRFWQAAGCPTKRAADWWDSAAFTSIFLASSFFCSQAESQPAHQRLTQTVGRYRRGQEMSVSCQQRALGKLKEARVERGLLRKG